MWGERSFTSLVSGDSSHLAAEGSSPRYTTSSHLCVLLSHLCGPSSSFCGFFFHSCGHSSSFCRLSIGSQPPSLGQKKKTSMWGAIGKKMTTNNITLLQKLKTKWNRETTNQKERSRITWATADRGGEKLQCCNQCLEKKRWGRNYDF